MLRLSNSQNCFQAYFLSILSWFWSWRWGFWSWRRGWALSESGKRQGFGGGVCASENTPTSTQSSYYAFRLTCSDLFLISPCFKSCYFYVFLLTRAQSSPILLFPPSFSSFQTYSRCDPLFPNLPIVHTELLRIFLFTRLPTPQWRLKLPNFMQWLEYIENKRAGTGGGGFPITYQSLAELTRA